MAASSSALVPVSSLDVQGMSVAVTNPSLTDARYGRAFHPTSFAVGVPVHFHPLASPTYLGLFSQRWYSAQINSTAYGQFTSHSVDVDPSWLLIQANTGDSTPVNAEAGAGAFSVNYRNNGEPKTLRAATSQGTYLMALTDVAGDTILSRWRSTTQNQVVVAHEEFMTHATVGVTYDAGIYVDRAFCYVWGLDSAGNVYTCRQVTGKIGSPDDWWQYQTNDGWSNDASLATPVTGLSSVGPMSTFVWRNRTYVTTVAKQGSDYVGEIWASQSMSDPWTMVKQIDLGTTDYAHQGIVLQPQLGLASSILPTLPQGIATAIPYVSATVEPTTIDINWDVLQIPA